MTFSLALSEAQNGRAITRPCRPNVYLIWNESRSYLEMRGPGRKPGEDGKPSPWVAQPGDKEAEDWIVLDQPAVEPPDAVPYKGNYMQCGYCGSRTYNPSPELIYNACLQCKHQFTLAALTGLLGHGYSPEQRTVTIALDMANLVIKERERRDREADK